MRTFPFAQVTVCFLAVSLSVPEPTVALAGVRPVSYTHLDVYKRQSPSRASASDDGPAATLVARGFGEPYRDHVARLAGAQKSGHGVPPYTRYINRPLGRRLAAMAAILRLTPNAVTGVSMLASYLGIALLCLVAPSQPVAIGVTLLLLLGYALDSADGQLARLTGRGGPCLLYTSRCV